MCVYLGVFFCVFWVRVLEEFWRAGRPILSSRAGQRVVAWLRLWVLPLTGLPAGCAMAAGPYLSWRHCSACWGGDSGSCCLPWEHAHLLTAAARTLSASSACWPAGRPVCLPD